MAGISKAVIDTLIAEAGGEGDIGLIAAAWAIQQRAAARGQTIDQVVRSGFDGFTNPGPAARKSQQDPAMRARVEQIMRGVSNGSIPNPVQGADHFLSGDVMPDWARKMKHVATINGHRFYASGNVPRSAYGVPMPPEDLPQVATALDVVPPPKQAPTPQTPSVAINKARSPGWSDALAVIRGEDVTTWDPAFYNGIFERPDPNPISASSFLDQPAIRETVAKTQAQQPGDLSAALGDYIVRQAAPKAVTPMPLNVAQSYAGQDRADKTKPSVKASPAQLAAAGAQGMPWGEADGPAQRLAKAAQSNGAPTPAQMSDKVALYRAPGETIATVSSTSGVGQAPKTNVVKSVPVAVAPKPATPSDNLVTARDPTAPATTLATIPTTVPATQKTAMQKAAEVYKQGGPTQPKTTAKMDPIGSMPVWGAFADALPANDPLTLIAEPAKPNPPGFQSGYVKDDNLRLAPSGVAAPGAKTQVAQVPAAAKPAVQIEPVKTASVPLPQRRPDRPQVATQLSTAPERKAAPVSLQPQTAMASSIAKPRAKVTIGDMLGNALRNAPLVKLLQGQNPFGGSGAPKLDVPRPFSTIDQAKVASMIGQGLLNAASVSALQSGSHSYVGSDGAVMPTTSMGGKIRNTYGD